MCSKSKYLFGPVPSRRLGLSLGVDIVPFKVCTLDCIYCQIGGTTEKTVERKEYVSCQAVLEELELRIAEGLEADYITISGSGEPALNSQLGAIIDGIKKITSIPVAVLTNGTLLTDSSVRADCAKADVVLPSLDAADRKTFERINRPHRQLDIEQIIEGLCSFRAEFTGQIWLEVFLIEGFNTDNGQISKLTEAVERIRPDKVQLNTAVRPTAEPGIKSLDAERLEQIAEKIGSNCEVAADFSRDSCREWIGVTAEKVLSMLKRRPCSLDDVCAGLGIAHNEALKHLEHLKQRGVIDSEDKGRTVFFKAN